MGGKTRKIKSCDFQLILYTAMLVIFGVVMVFSASYYYSISKEGTPYGYLKKEAIFAVTGFVLMAITSFIDYHKWKRLSLAIAIGSLFLLVLVLTPVGHTFNEARRWILIGPISLMPGEIAKIAIIIFASAWLAGNDISDMKDIKNRMVVYAYIAITCILIYEQPNLSTAITNAVIGLGIMFLAGLPIYTIGAFLVVGVVGFFGIINFGPTYQVTRILSFRDPFQFAESSGFQVVQGLLAMGSGGIGGVGIGKSVQKTLYLPEPHTDFILAVIGEELGFVGIAIMMTVFVLLIWRCFTVSINAKDRFGMLFAGGVGIMIAIQLILNIAVVTSSMPPTGVALPFITYGGNSLWIFMGMLGIVLNISRQNNIEAAPAAMTEPDKVESSEKKRKRRRKAFRRK